MSDQTPPDQTPPGQTRATLLVVAKAPVPGEVKTRLTPPLTSHQAAAVAAAALLDTLDVVREAAAVIGTRPVLALTGSLEAAAAPDALARSARAFRVVDQRGDTFADRLAAAHQDAGGPDQAATVQVGMDTPQLSVDQLVSAARRVTEPRGTDAVLGPAEDGGWWLLALRRATDAELLRDIAMSTDRTGELTRASLLDAGRTVESTDVLRDVDHVDDLSVVAAAAPVTRFARLIEVLGPDLLARVSGVDPRSGSTTAGLASTSVDGEAS